MAASVAGPEIERLIQLLARLPGLGPRSARRAALHLIKKREALMTPLAGALQVAIDKIQVCKTCGNIDTQNPCTVCTDPRRDPSTIEDNKALADGLQGHLDHMAKKWLSKMFGDINYGRHQEFSLPRRIEVSVPTPVLV